MACGRPVRFQGIRGHATTNRDSRRPPHLLGGQTHRLRLFCQLCSFWCLNHRQTSVRAGGLPRLRTTFLATPLRRRPPRAAAPPCRPARSRARLHVAAEPIEVLADRPGPRSPSRRPQPEGALEPELGEDAPATTHVDGEPRETSLSRTIRAGSRLRQWRVPSPRRPAPLKRLTKSVTRSSFSPCFMCALLDGVPSQQHAPRLRARPLIRTQRTFTRKPHFSRRVDLAGGRAHGRRREPAPSQTRLGMVRSATPVESIHGDRLRGPVIALEGDAGRLWSAASAPTGEAARSPHMPGERVSVRFTMGVTWYGWRGGR